MKTFLTLFFVYLLAPSVSAKLVSKLSSQLNDYNLNISSQYNIAVFSRSEAHFKNATIWQVAIAKNGSFKTPHKLTLGPKQYSYSDPMLSPDGQTLLFISDMPLASEYKRDDYNIWQASWSLGQWTNIHPLSSVNSEADELGPEIHNGTLYFSSTRSGKLSLYKTDIVNKSSKVTPYKAIQHKTLSQSDLTFSPDGNIALFWQLSEDRKDSILMMQQRTSAGWGLPKMMHNQVQSIAFEFTPQFSPDGQWLYISSARKTDDYQQLNIHKFPTKEIFPHAWYNNNLGKVELDILANRKQMNSIKTFEYDLNIKQGNSEKIQHIKIDFTPFQIWQTKAQQVSWSDGSKGYKLTSSGEKQSLPEAEIKQLLKTARYNFIYMFKQENTALFRQYSTKSEQGKLYRVEAEGLSAFTVLLDPSGIRIEQLRYDDLAVGLEHDYKLINGIFWPMKFEFIVDYNLLARGIFSNVEIN